MYQFVMLFSRELLEKQEAECLASYAVKSRDSLGREFPEEKDKYRLIFQKDKERVIHSKAFRRLDQKTQVLTAGTGDHYRTRLTHTLEVAQISRGMARRLGLNEDLAEVIALAHDLGHPPFGHAGEDALNEIMQEFGAHFEHNEQSKRVVETLERSYPHFKGLNLSMEVREGLMKHQTAFDQEGKIFEVSAHLEAQIVNIGDETAYINHDIDDGLRSGLISLEQLGQFALWRAAGELAKEKHGQNMGREILIARTISKMISLMINDLCVNTTKNLEENKIETLDDVKNYQGALAVFSEEMRAKIDEIRHFLYQNFYLSEEVVTKNAHGKEMIKKTFYHLMKHPQSFGWEKIKSEESSLEVAVKDYIAGMTDRFLISLSHDLS